MRVLNRQDVLQIIHGAAFLSTGAGGTLRTGLRMLADYEKENKVSLVLIGPEEMEEGTCAANVIGYGSPDAFLDTAFGQEAQDAYEAMRDALAREGKRVSCLYSLEFAGFNTFTPVYVAMRNGLPLLDVDCNGKAIPDFERSLHTARGAVIPPVYMGARGDQIIYDPQKKDDYATLGLMLHKVCEAYDWKIGMASCVCTKEQIARTTIAGAVTLAQKVGAVVLDNIAAHRESPDPDGCAFMERLRQEIDPRIDELCRGRIVRFDKDAQAAFNMGTAVIENEADGRLYYVDFKNENLLVRTDEEVLVTVPETICTYLADTGEPITNSELAEGMRIGICVIPAPEEWWEIPEGYGMYRSMLAEVGYEGEAVRPR